MDILVSGEAGIAIQDMGSSLQVWGRHDPSVPLRHPLSSLRQLLGGAQDFRWLAVTGPEDVPNIVAEEALLSDARILLLLCLDQTTLEEDREDCVDALNELLAQHQHLGARLLDLFCSVVFPASQFLSVEMKELKGPTGGIQRQVQATMASTVRCEELFDKAAAEVLEDPSASVAAKSELKSAGVFGRFARAIQAKSRTGLIVADAIRQIAHIPGHRSLVMRWSQLLGGKQATTPSFKQLVERERDLRQATRSATRPIRRLPAQEALALVNRQKDAISAAIEGGDVQTATRYIDELVELQLSMHQDPDEAGKYLAMSLCDLGQTAKHAENHMLQLELSKRAVGFAPRDPQAHGQYADALLIMGQLDKAEQEYKATRAWGKLNDEQFAVNGLGRILKAEGKLQQALEHFEEAKSKYPLNSHCWNEWAESYRDLHRYDEAVAAYEEVIREFPEEHVSRAGYAAALLDSGEVQRSLDEYNGIIAEFGNIEVPLCGRAHVRWIIGDIDQSVADYNFVLQLYPKAPAAHPALATVLLKSGQLEGAETAAKAGMQERPYDPSLRALYAAALRERGSSEAALKVLDENLSNFPYYTRSFLDQIEIVRRLGMREKALLMSAQAVRRWPHSIAARHTQAQLFKQLGRYKESAHVYQEIVDRFPYSESSKVALSALQRIVGDQVRPLSNLRQLNPKTVADWRQQYVHELDMIERPSGDQLQVLGASLNTTPYEEIRGLYRTALAVERIAGGEAPVALELLTREHSTFAALLKGHALGELNRTAEARSAIKAAIGVPERLVPLQQALESKYLDGRNDASMDAAWLWKEESMHALLEAA